jgi:hypothetical protein
MTVYYVIVLMIIRPSRNQNGAISTGARAMIIDHVFDVRVMAEKTGHFFFSDNFF